jgi:hypothetical protein
VAGIQVIGFLLALPLSSEESWFELTYVGRFAKLSGQPSIPEKILDEIKGWPVASMQM